MTWSADQAKALADELAVKSEGRMRLEYVSNPGGRNPSRWVCSGMPQEVYLGAQEAGVAFAAVLAGFEAARLPNPDQTPAP